MDFTDNSAPVNADDTADTADLNDKSPEAVLTYLHSMGAMLKEKRARRDRIEKLREVMLDRAAALIPAEVLMLYHAADGYEAELDELDDHIERLVGLMRSSALPVQAYQSWSKSPASASAPSDELVN